MRVALVLSDTVAVVIVAAVLAAATAVAVASGRGRAQCQRWFSCLLSGFAGIDLAGVVDSDFQANQINFAPPRRICQFSQGGAGRTSLTDTPDQSQFLRYESNWDLERSAKS